MTTTSAKVIFSRSNANIAIAFTSACCSYIAFENNHGNSRTKLEAKPPMLQSQPPSTSTSKLSSVSPIPKPITASGRILHRLHIRTPHLPRLLSPNDPSFSIPSRLVRQRSRDEQTLLNLQKQGMEAGQNRDFESIRCIQNQIMDVAYGKNVTPQQRQTFVQKYGCAAYSDDILEIIQNLGNAVGTKERSRGILEVGAGHGQWAAALMAYRHARDDNEKTGKGEEDDAEWIKAYDDMTSLPLPPSRFQPKPTFYSHVRRMNHIDALRDDDGGNNGRILLMVFPPPGPMAHETLLEYKRLSPENDTLVYVGEGKNGANANDDFFRELESSGDWILVDVREMGEKVGDKGFEKFFVLKRVR